MNGFTLRWFGKLVSSLVKYNPQLKAAKKLKETKDWRECKAVVDQHIYDWLNPLVDMAGVEFIVEGKEIETIMRRVNFSDYESLAYFHQTLRKMGVDAALRRKGIKEGDIVKIFDWEFEYEE